MATSLEDLVADTRLESGLRNNRLFSDDQIAGLLTNGFWALRDLMIAKFAYWFRAEKPFSLAGGVNGNVFELSEVPDLEMIQGLFLVTSSGELQRVDMLSSVSEIGYLNSTYPFADVWSFNGYVGRKYFPDGDKLFIYPAANASGNYLLVYTPQAQKFAFPVVRTFNIAAADTNPPVTPSDNMPGPGYWFFANGNFNTVQFDATYATDIPTDGTAYIDTNFSAGPPDNTSFNGRWFINGVSDSAANVISVTPAQVGNVTGPAAGTATITYQPVGTIGELPASLNAWQRYLVLYASRIIRQERRQPMGDIQFQFDEISKRISALTKQRSEGVRQAPIRRGFGGGTFGNGGGFGY